MLLTVHCTGVEVEERRLYTGVQILRTAPLGTEEEELVQSLGDSVEVRIGRAGTEPRGISRGTE